MLNITSEEARALLQKMRQVKQVAGEAVALLEHTIQLYGGDGDDNQEFPYNPDDYIERLKKQELFYDDFGYSRNAGNDGGVGV